MATTSPSIKLIRASDGSGNASAATVQAIRSGGATTIQVDTVQGIPDNFYASMGTPHTFTDPVTGETITVISEATAVDFEGHVDGTDLEIDAIGAGYVDNGSAVGDIIVIRPTTSYANNIADILDVEHNDNGTHGAVTADSLDVSGATTLASLLVGGFDPTVRNLYANAIINGGCMVAQRAAPNISTSYQYGKVDRFAAKGSGTAVSAGTINQNTSTLVAAQKGYEIKLAGVTITGTGIVYLRYRMEAKDALMFKNAATSFSCRVHHDVGSAINATVYIRKANAADNFAAVTDIANSGAVSIPNNTGTLLKFENINTGNIGDVSNGIEIEIQLACGAVTTKNFSFGEFVFSLGAKANAFNPDPYQDVFARCQRYYQVSSNWSWRKYVSNVHRETMKLPVEMRTTPTIAYTAPLGNLGANSTSTNYDQINVDVQYTAGGSGVIDGTWSSISLTAEL